MVVILFIVMLSFSILMGLLFTKCVRKFLTRLKEKEVFSSIWYLLLSGYIAVIYFGFIAFTLSIPGAMFVFNAFSMG